MIGVSFGAPTEFRYRQKIIEGDPPKWTPDRVSNAIGQDDLYVDMTFAKVLDDEGLDATTDDFGAMFKDARLPRASGELCWRAGLVMNYGDGIYGGMFVSGMYAVAFFENDPRKVVEAGLACMPAKSPFARRITDVLAWSRQYPRLGSATSGTSASLAVPGVILGYIPDEWRAASPCWPNGRAARRCALAYRRGRRGIRGVERSVAALLHATSIDAEGEAHEITTMTEARR